MEKYYLLPFKFLKDSALKWFQYRILVTNTFLHKIHYMQSNACCFYSVEPETLHLFMTVNL